MPVDVEVDVEVDVAVDKGAPALTADVAVELLFVALSGAGSGLHRIVTNANTKRRTRQLRYVAAVVK